MSDHRSDALVAPAVARNRDLILAVLRQLLPTEGTVLKIASGSGEHAVYFAAGLRVFGSIADAATKGGEVSNLGFGRFRVRERGARKGRNPQTGEAIKTAASKRRKFIPARAMKTAPHAVYQRHEFLNECEAALCRWGSTLQISPLLESA